MGLMAFSLERLEKCIEFRQQRGYWKIEFVILLPSGRN